MPVDLKGYRIFIASPGGLNDERIAFRDTLDEYNHMDAVRRGALFVPVGWEDTLGGIGRPQTLINEDVVTCDYFVLLLWDRWGSPPDPEVVAGRTSGTEEEYLLSVDCFYDPQRPMRQIVVFFKGVDERQLSDPGEQLRKVLEFKSKLCAEKTLLFHTFDEASEFAGLLRRYLAEWVRDHEDGHSSKVAKPQPPAPPRLTTKEPSPEIVDQFPTSAKDTPETVKRAMALADEGRLVQAEAEFARAIVQGYDPNALLEYGNFLARVGRLGQARVMFERVCAAASGERKDDTWSSLAHRMLGNLSLTTGDLPQAETSYRESLAISEALDSAEGIAASYGNLGLIYQTRGDLDKAEEMHRKSLEIEEKFGRLEGVAREYSSLGLIYRTRGDLDKAEQMHRKALEIEEKLGRLKGMATQYGNLGVIYQTRGDLDNAEKMHRKSLEISEKLGWLESVASEYCNLGVIYQTRGDLDGAEQMHRKSLEIDEKLGQLKAMARQHCNLGVIYQTRGDLDEAEQMLRKSLEISEKLGWLEGMASNYGNLGLIYKTRGDLDKAEQMLRKSLEIDEKLGRLEGMANTYGNLGLIYQTRGDLDKAEQMYCKSLEIDEKLGRLEGMAKQYGNLGLIYRTRDDVATARSLWTKARDLYQQIGIPHMVEKMQSWLDALPPDTPDSA